MEILEKNALYATWDRAPDRAFTEFVHSSAFTELSKRVHLRRDHEGNVLPIQDSSAETYLVMWSKLIRWMAGYGKQLRGLTGDDITVFLETRDAQGTEEAKSKIRAAYLMLLERVYKHLQVVPNPVTELIDQPGKRFHLGVNDALVYLSPEQESKFWTALPIISESNGRYVKWERFRDRAIQVMMIDAGLKSSQIIALNIENILGKQTDGSRKIKVEKASVEGKGKNAENIVAVKPHETVMSAAGVYELETWLEVREQSKITSSLLFPANRLGEPIDRTNIFRQVQATFVRAGIEVAHKGGRTLRNTFAIKQLIATNYDTKIVGEYLGHWDEDALRLYIEAAKMYSKYLGQSDASSALLLLRA